MDMNQYVLRFYLEKKEGKQLASKTRELVNTSMELNELDDDVQYEDYTPVEGKYYDNLDDDVSNKPRLTTFSDMLKTNSSTKKHVRGPSKIQEILDDLQANVASDFKKLSTLLSESDKKSHQSFKEPCRQEQIMQQVNNLRKRRKKSRLPKYLLDIIEEQSNDQFTPDRSLMFQESVQSVPCFSEATNHNVEYRSQQQYKLKFDDIFLELQRLRSFRFGHDKEEEALLASWSRLCNEIIRKNHLPVQLNIDMIQNQCEYQSNSSKIRCGKENCDFSPNFSDICKKIQFTSDGSVQK